MKAHGALGQAEISTSPSGSCYFKQQLPRKANKVAAGRVPGLHGEGLPQRAGWEHHQPGEL